MSRNIPKIAGLLFLGVVLPLLALGLFVIDGSPPTPAAESAPPPVTPPPPTDPVEALRLDLTSDIDADRLIAVRLQGTRLVVEYRLTEGLTMNQTARINKRAVAAIAQKAHTSPIPFDSLFVAVVAALKDTYGHSSDSRVIVATYPRATLAKVNWAGFNFENIYEIADRPNVHRELR